MGRLRRCCQHVQLEHNSTVLTVCSLNELTKDQSKPEVAKNKDKSPLTCGFPLLPFPKITPSLCGEFSDIKLLNSILSGICLIF